MSNIHPLGGAMPDEQDAIDRLIRRSEFVQCRTFGHSWDSIPVTEPDPDGPQFWLRCVRCSTLRKDTIDRYYGSVLRRHYDYPDDYSLKAEQVPTRDEFRLHLIKVGEDLAERRAAKRKAQAS